jgi:HAD superfamily hydrolase (TIGR01549 family)
MNEQIQQTYKSNDTEEWLDVVWTRPIGYQWARFFNALNVHPNTVTIMSMMIGVASAFFFVDGSYRTEGMEGLLYNIIGVLLLAWANFYDSADGQLARMTGKKTQLGRILDGAAGDVWFFAIYHALTIRFYFHLELEFQWLGIENTERNSIIATLIFYALAWFSGIFLHARQCGLSDYYRQIHLFFLKGKEGSELDNSAQQQAIYQQTPWKGNVIYKLFLLTYINYTRSQEKQTPQFQQLWRQLQQQYGSVDKVPQPFRERFRQLSLPMMKWANILTFNTRAITLYISCLIDFPWLYLLMEMTVFTGLYLYMRHTHEQFCKKINNEAISSKKIQGIIFDYGGTIDTNALHWSEVLWEGYEQVGIPVSKEEFRTSYVTAERALAKHPYIRPEHNFLDLLTIKCDLETRDLTERNIWKVSDMERKEKSDAVANYCYQYVLKVLEESRPVIAQLAETYPLVLVSNFYGNIETILKDFHLTYFQRVIESAVVGVRKPDPKIFQLGVDALREVTGKSAEELPANEILVVGDSFSKDIVPASKIGCQTVWMKGIGWGEEDVDESVPTHIIHHLKELPKVLQQA